MNLKKISDIADIQVGLILSRKEDTNGIEYNRLTLPSLDGGELIEKRTLDKFCAKGVLEKQYVTCEKDIIMRTFSPLNPTLIAAADSDYVIPSQMMKVVVTDKNILPEYVQCFLAQEVISSRLSKEDTGTPMRTIKSSSIANLKIPIPSIEKQRQIAEIYRLSIKKRKLLAELAKYEKQLCESVIGNHFKIGGVE